MDEAPVAIVTGAARGIGAATVHRLAHAGWRVVAVDACADDPAVPYPLATPAQLRSIAQAHKGTVVEVIADVRDPAALADAVRLTEERFGRLDAAVAAAAVITGGGRPLWETTTQDWAPMFDIGVHGVANLARAAIPSLLRRSEPRTGRFVALASAAAHHGMWQLAGYNAAKHAVVGLVKGLANDLRGSGVTAVAVSPGSTRTDLLAESARLYDLDTVDAFADHQLIGRIVEPDEVAAVVAWLCSPESGCVTGSVIHADGGFLP
ncbi:MAG: putative oxidoreductase, family [Nocardia sp.]|uniref:mycofactocin-coupled SDR family oxidoreductase n=1 Tax=Nocardia sp. TaxID=1821 RepID=UPI0026354E06|nr:mycofactocin-coupled SDR family oxidoreductase [Nocardia sp.]MCU1644411.1 putative oxidoreductase, family [Nocardia sp.]